MLNNKRYDLSNRLIHFFRKVNQNGKNSVNFPENWGLDHLVEKDELNPFFLLRAAIRRSRLFATWAVRDNKRTIYGEKPAICFTEMPLGAFIQSSRQRSALGQAISTYGISFTKKELYSLGARPVIYGLSGEEIRIIDSGSKARIIDESLLPLREQYRYVTFNPIDKIDWTHEREWRWAYPSSVEEFEKTLEEFGVVSEVEDFPSLIFSENFTDIGIIVQTENEAKLVISDILAEYDRQGFTPYKFVFYTDQISSQEALLSPEQENHEISKNLIDLSEFTLGNSLRDDKIYSKFMELILSIEKKYPKIESGELGGCWLWLYDNMDWFTRALINKGRVEVNNQNKYLCFPLEFDNRRSLQQREHMIEDLASILKSEFNVDCGYFSVLYQNDFDGVPYYHSQDFREKYWDRITNIAY